MGVFCLFVLIWWSSNQHQSIQSNYDLLFHYRVGSAYGHYIVRHYLTSGIWLTPWYLQFVLIVYIIGTSCIGLEYLITHFWVSIYICGLKQRIVLNRNLINKGWWKQTVTVNYHSYLFFSCLFRSEYKKIKTKDEFLMAFSF